MTTKEREKLAELRGNTEREAVVFNKDKKAIRKIFKKELKKALLKKGVEVGDDLTILFSLKKDREGKRFKFGVSGPNGEEKTYELLVSCSVFMETWEKNDLSLLKTMKELKDSETTLPMKKAIGEIAKWTLAHGLGKEAEEAEKG